MTETEEEQDRGPDKPTLPVEQAQRDQCKQKRLRDPFMDSAEESVRDVPAIELPDWQQVQSRCKESKPCRDPDRVKIDGHSRGRSLSHNRFQELENQRLAELQSRARRTQSHKIGLG